MPAASCSAKIHVLPGDVVSRIAAGEVIERPAAVVKELLENSLDAGGLHVTIDIKDGGVTLVRVTDDGEGISRTDLPLAFERHATSKLKSDLDLASVTTMGFRGEALPSIASVSHVLVTTATRQDTVGCQLTLVAGAGGAIERSDRARCAAAARTPFSIAGTKSRGTTPPTVSSENAMPDPRDAGASASVTHAY